MRITSFVALLLTTLLVDAGPRYDLEKGAAGWRAWISGDVDVPRPPGAAATKKELGELLHARRPSVSEMDSIRYWDAGAPGYRWNQIAYELAKESDIPVERVYALLNVAIYDATVAAWRTKYKYGRVRPYDAAAGLRPLIPTTASPSYPSEHAAVAGAAAEVLSHLFPRSSGTLSGSAEACARSRVAAGVQYESDVRAGLKLGRDIGARVVAWAKEDRSDATWEGSVPSGAGLWNGRNPENPAIARWRTWVLQSPDQFRPAAPPTFGDAALSEVKDPAINTGPHRRAAYLWAISSLAKHWNELASLKIFEQRLDRNPPRAARVYAVLSTAYYDALIACWDAKYAYWGIRPNQLDPSFKSLIPTPNFPGYPSGHATFAGTAATVLAEFFPADAPFFERQAEEAAASRLWAGVHFRIDNEAGLQLGRAVGRAAIARAKSDGGALTAP